MTKPPAKRRAQPANQSGAQPSVQHVSVSSATWSAPLPPPEILAQYSSVIPDGAERMMKIWENETAHRQQMEIEDRKLARKDLNIVFWDVLTSRFITFAFLLSMVGGATYAAVNGAPLFAGVFGAGTVGTVVWALRHNMKAREKSR